MTIHGWVLAGAWAWVGTIGAGAVHGVGTHGALVAGVGTTGAGVAGMIHSGGQDGAWAGITGVWAGTLGVLRAGAGTIGTMATHLLQVEDQLLLSHKVDAH